MGAMTDNRKKLIRAIEEMSDRYPDWRIGQLILNVLFWTQDPDPHYTSGDLYNVENEELLHTIRDHLDRRFGTDPAPPVEAPIVAGD